TLNHATSGLYSGANGRAYPLVYPRVYGSLGNQGLATVHNAGTLDAYPLITLTAAPGVPLVNPQVRLVGGTQVQVAITVDPGGTLLIDLQNQVVLLNGIADRTGLVNGTFFSCPPGDSQILFTADSGLGATLDAAWRDPYP
ncbi:MAG: phage distal tail protein, partial [Jatrophihabitans sp.]